VKGLSHAYTCIHSSPKSPPSRLWHNIELSSMCYTVCPWLSIFLLLFLFFKIYYFIYFFISIFFFFWRLITPQYRGGFRHTLTWISHECPSIPILKPQTPLSPPYPLGLSQRTSFEWPASCIELALVIYFTYGDIHASVLFPHLVP